MRSSAGRLYGDVLGEKPRQRDARAGVGVQPQSGERLLRQQATAGGDREQAQIGRRSGQRLVHVLVELRQHPARRARQAAERFFQPQAAPAERRIVGRVHRLDDAAQLAEISFDDRAAVERQLAGDEIDRLDAVGAFIDRGDARVAIKLCGAGLLDKAHAAVHLHAERSDFDADVAGKRLGQRRQQRGAGVRRLAGGLVGAALGAIERHCGGVADAARGLGERAHGHEHALDVGMGDDRRRLGCRHSRCAALLALARIGDRLLRGALGDADALQADGKPGAVHHGEHGRHAGILLADEETGGAAMVAEHHRAGRRSVDAEFVLDRVGAHVVAGARRAVGIEQEFRHQKQRNAARAGRRVRQPRQHEMNDVVGEVVLAVGDEDLLAGDAVGAVAGAYRARAQRADVGAGLRLGQMHRSGPFAGDELFEIRALERVAAMSVECVDRAHGQQRTEAERHRGAVPHFGAGGVDGLRQTLTAPFGRRGKAVPAAFAPGAISLFPAGRGGDDAVLEGRADLVADAIERPNHFGGHAAGFGQHRLDVVHGEVAEEAFLERGQKRRPVFERKAHVGEWGVIGHGAASA